MKVNEMLGLLEEKPTDRWLVVALGVGLLFLVISYFLFAPYFAVLAPSGYSIIDQQTVFTYEANERILSAWKGIEGGIRASLMCAYIDLFPFMPAYVLVGLAWGILVARRVAGKARRVGIVCSLSILPAWLADIVETGIQAWLSSNVDSYSPGLVPVMSTAAVIKTVFFYTAVIWCLVGTVLALIARVKSDRRLHEGQ